jgi:hypothetical protein
MPKSKDEDLITQAEAAELRGVTTQAINELIQRGRLATVGKYGRQLLRRADVLSFEPQTHKRKATKGKGKK